MCPSVVISDTVAELLIAEDLWHLALFVSLLSGAIIVDACSIERNRILVSSYCVGGPNERKLPPHCLIKVGMYFYIQILLFSGHPHILHCSHEIPIFPNLVMA